MKQKLNIFWFRRDLRLHDNKGLFAALKSGLPVLPIFIFDTKILNKLTQKNDARVTFIHQQIQLIKTKLEEIGSSLLVYNNTPEQVFHELNSIYTIHTVFTNKDYEPYGIERDKNVREILTNSNVDFVQFNDHVIFKPNTIKKANGEPYTVFTPYSKKWIELYESAKQRHYPSEKHLSSFVKVPAFKTMMLRELGFSESEIVVNSFSIDKQLIEDYEKCRDFPSISGTSKLGPHLRFGTVSIREVTGLAHGLSLTFLKELIWRNFFIDILWHFPHVVNQAFKSRYEFISWRNNEKEFKLWRQGRTGYPLVDAGMRELNSTGFMHNRVRMITASFLTKHLLVDWRWGEAYFAEKLLDFELASNNGNWQWAAGCGCDAAPYFRIFNPENQQKKFDRDNEYIKKWLPEFGTESYPAPIVDHKMAYNRALATYKNALK